ncbi:MAG TPA: sugar transferase [Terriglobales bacterium]|nr:sugar transferase [Terriglobales bacterium]
MSSPFPNPSQDELKPGDCARLIPGEMPRLPHGGRKPPQSVRTVPPERVPDFSTGSSSTALESLLTLLFPAALQGRNALRWLRSATADCALVGLNWLLLGALLVPLRMEFPQVRLFAFKAGAPASLLGVALLHATLITLFGDAEGLYAPAKDLPQQTKILGKAIWFATVVLALGYVLQGAPWTTAVLMIGAGALHLAALWAWRWQGGKRWLRADESDQSRKVLIVGAGGSGRRMAAFLEAHPGDGRSIYGFLDNERPLGGGVIGRVRDLARLARTGFVDEVILTSPCDSDVALEVLREAKRLRLDVELVPEAFGCRLSTNDIEQVGDMPVIRLHVEHLPTARLVLKRLVDVIGSSVSLLVLSPLLAAIAASIKLDSPGPVLYRAQRAGRKGRLFRCYKFRTMVSNADALKDRLRQDNERSGPIFKIASDPRITRLGRLLRRYSLDELPQLWNVLKGEMSLVGPRPHPADDYAAYEIGHLARLDVTPGITGLWQVTARRDPSFQRGMELDREYIRTWSLGSDMRILAKTVLAVVRGSGQ